jgi:serine/threonine-protein phosphatase PGAM5
LGSQGDENRTLTDLGRLQAELTGKRLREIVSAEAPGDPDRGLLPCRVKCLRVSSMARAKETADIIASYLPIDRGNGSIGDRNGGAGEGLAAVAAVVYLEPDPALSEGRPCHHIPGVRATPKVVEVTDDNHARIEGAFQRYFYRAPHVPRLPPALAATASSVLQEGGSSTSKNVIGGPGSTLAAAAAVDPSSSAQNPVAQQQQQPQASQPPSPQDLHEFEIIVCHANVIRYFVCR